MYVFLALAFTPTDGGGSSEIDCLCASERTTSGRAEVTLKRQAQHRSNAEGVAVKRRPGDEGHVS